MTVAELMNELKEYDPNQKVRIRVFYDQGWDCADSGVQNVGMDSYRSIDGKYRKCVMLVGDADSTGNHNIYFLHHF